MGYRSDVVLAIAPEAASAFMTLCAKRPKVLDLCHEADEFKSGYEQEGDYFMYWADIKWYNSDDEIAAINTFVEMLDSDDMSEYGERHSVKTVTVQLSGMNTSSLFALAEIKRTRKV